MRSNFNCFLFSFFLLNIAGVKGVPKSDLTILWRSIDSLNTNLPEGIRVFEGVNEEIPLTAWYALIDLKDANLKVDVVTSDDSSGRETVSSFAEDL